MRGLGVLMVLVGMAVQGWAEGLFGQLEIRANRPDSIPKWTDVSLRTEQENLLARCMAGNCQNDRANWFEKLAEWRALPKFEQIVVVNRWLNNFRYITDDKLWGVSDYWATPGEFLEKSGDCEDYALAKYYTLKNLGWPESALRLVVVHDAVRDIPHAVLAVKYGTDNYILDNLATEPLQDRFVTQYTPYYAINKEARWVFIKPLTN